MPGPRTTVIDRSTFESVIDVAAGSTVTWVNQDGVSHTVTSFAGSVDSPFLTSGQSFSLTFGAPGRLDYYCRLHQQMTASVVVH